MKNSELKIRLFIFAFIFGMGWNGLSFAASKVEIDTKVKVTLEKFYEEVGAGKELANKASGILVFPSVIKAGIGIGGEYGEGALRINGRTVEYFNTAAASIGFQLGAQSKSIILLFMAKDALSNFRNSEGWEVGVDGSVSLIKIGAGGSVDTTNIKDPIIGFVFGQKGLMYNLTLEGSKITRIKK
jgi:lipid-binding SYLF domain-containing protein